MSIFCQSKVFEIVRELKVSDNWKEEADRTGKATPEHLTIVNFETFLQTPDV